MKNSIINKTIVIDAWRVSNSNDMVLVRAYKRVTGWLQEMESTKQLVENAGQIYRLGLTILDLSSAGGYYYKGPVLLESALGVLDKHFATLHPTFKVIKECKMGRDINSLVKSFACHNGLKGLD